MTDQDRHGYLTTGKITMNITACKKGSWYGDPGSSPGMTKDKHTYMQREILKQVQDDIGYYITSHNDKKVARA
jgi:hypothetical protein